MAGQNSGSVVDRLAAALAATDAAGRLRFRLVDVEDFLAILILRTPVEQRGTDQDGLELLGRFALRCGMKATADEAAVVAAVDAYLSEHPLNPEILQAAQLVVTSKLTEGTGSLGSALTSFADDAKVTAPLGGSGPRPAGTVAGGPMARFLVVAPKKKP
ncbi:MAG: hypothetical protein Q8O67_09520 [Deltaproteobacteria bacterium]|nr:hypothetical protein [Deltaproteobacteria bacterium]